MPITTIEAAKRKQCRIVQPLSLQKQGMAGAEVERRYSNCVADGCMQWSALEGERGFCGMVNDVGNRDITVIS